MGPVQTPLRDALPVRGRGPSHVYAILIHVNVAMGRSAEMAASEGGQGWFFGELIRKGQLVNSAETAV
jgi:hypothetical protein